MKNIVTSLARWMGTLAVLGLAIVFMTACDFNFDISLNGDDVNVTGVAGTAKKVEGKLSVSGKSCHVKIKRSFVVGQNGCATLQFSICGQSFNEQICGLQPGSNYQLEIEVDGGGMIAMQVPTWFMAPGDWKLHNVTTGHDVPVVFSDKPFNYSPLHPFEAEPGKKILYAKWDESLPDSVFIGQLSGSFMAAPMGLDTVKVIFCGQARFKSAVTGKGVLVGRDSNYIFAELPTVYQFSRVTAPFLMPVHVANGVWNVLDSKTAIGYGLPVGADDKYIAVTYDGATAAQLQDEYTLNINGAKATGRMYSVQMVKGRETIMVHFKRSEFYAVADSTKGNASADVVATTNTSSFPTRFTMNGSIPREVVIAGVTGQDNVAGGMRMMGNYPNPFSKVTTVSYYIPSDGNVSVAIYDRLGSRVRTVTESYQSAGAHQVQIEAGELPTGMYRVELRMGGNRCSQEIIVVR